MDFGPAIVAGFVNYVRFSGRAVRSEYWYWALFVGILNVAARLADTAVFGRHFSFGSFGPFRVAWDIVFLLPNAAAIVRRLHDTDRSGWWFGGFFIAAVIMGFAAAILHIPLVVPIVAAYAGAVALICLLCLSGTPGPNRYGPDPFGPDGHVSQRQPT
jgi:uncharacterized membrane protein YhaH (DUF805 family)